VQVPKEKVMTDHLETALEEVFSFSKQRPRQQPPDEQIERICAAHGLSGEERALIENVAKEMAGDRPAGAPAMDNASLYRAPTDLLLT
jgi:hypothetical protein